MQNHLSQKRFLIIFFSCSNFNPALYLPAINRTTVESCAIFLYPYLISCFNHKICLMSYSNIIYFVVRNEYSAFNEQGRMQQLKLIKKSIFLEIIVIMNKNIKKIRRLKIAQN